MVVAKRLSPGFGFSGGLEAGKAAAMLRSHAEELETGYAGKKVLITVSVRPWIRKRKGRT